MKSILLLSIFALALQPVQAQLATKASAPSVNNYGKLFGDGSNLYEVSNDTLNAISTTSGARTFLSKLPGAPGGSGIVRWAKPFAVKTPSGFIIAQDVVTTGRTTYVWAGNGTGTWDTFAVVPGTTGPGEPYRLGSKYAMYVPTNGGQLLRTDGTRAGTSVVVAPVTGVQSYKRGNSRLFFWAGSAPGAPSTYTQRIYTVDDNNYQVIDSSSNVALPLATIGNDLYYEYKHQVNTGGTTVATTHNLKKWTAAGSSQSVLTPGLSALSYFVTGTAFNGKIIASKVDSGHHAEDLVAIDPATGIQTYLTANPASAFYPTYDVNNSGAGTVHLYIMADSGGKSATWVTDGSTMAGTKKIYQAPTGSAFYISQPERFGPFQAAICGDDVYGGQYKATGTFDMQVFSLNANGGLGEQDLNTGVIGGSDPNYFVHAGNEIFFTTQQTSSTNGPRDLYKITACSAITGTGNAWQPLAVQVYPNPAHELVSVRMGAGSAWLELYDATGRRVLRAAAHDGQSYSVRTLPAGMYIYRLTSNEAEVLVNGRIAVTH